MAFVHYGRLEQPFNVPGPFFAFLLTKRIKHPTLGYRGLGCDMDLCTGSMNRTPYQRMANQ